MIVESRRDPAPPGNGFIRLETEVLIKWNPGIRGIKADPFNP
jgi:hypothetical protein